MDPLPPPKVTQFVPWPLAISCLLPVGLNFHLYADDAHNCISNPGLPFRAPDPDT